MGSHAILILCLLLPLAISPWAFDDAYYLKETFLLLAGGGLLFGEAMALWRGYTKWVSLPTPLLLFLAFGLASVWQVTNVWAFTFRLALLLAGVAVFIAAARSASPSDLLTALGIAGATATGYGVIQRLGLDPILAPDARFIATFGNPQLYAEFVAPLLPAALCLALVVRGRRSTATAAAGLGFLFTGLLWARVRGPALAAIIALGFLLWALARSCPGLIQHRRKRLLACAGILAGVAILMALTGNIVVWKTWAPPARPDSSRSAAAVTPGRPASTGDLGADFRLAVYRDTLAMIREKPLTGFGLGNFRIGYPAFGKSLGSAHPEMGTEVTPVGHVHNDVLEVAAELGLPGAVVFLWMFLCFIWAGLKAAQALRPEEAWPRLAAGAGLVALAVNSLFAFGFYDPAAGLELWVFAGIAMAPVAGTIASETPEIARRSVRMWRRGAAVLLGALGLSAAWVGVSSEIADIFLMRGLARFYTGRYAEAVAPLKSAARLGMGRTEAMVMLAQTYMQNRRPGRALAVVQEGLGLEPNNPQLYYLRGISLAGMGRLEDARRAHETALGLYPLYSLPHMALGEMAERRGEDVQARAEYEAALSLNPRRAEARDALALLAVKAGDLDEAIRLWEAGARLDPEDATTARNLSVAYRKKGDQARAAAWQTRAAVLRAPPGTR